MKNLKRLFALLLTLAIMMSMAVTVSATEAKPAPIAMPDESRIVIHGAGAGTTYRVYRILDIVDYSLDDQGNVKDIVYCLRSDSPEWKAFFERDDVKCYFTIDNDYVRAVNFVGGDAIGDLTAQQLAHIAKGYIDSITNFPCDGEAKPLKSGTHTGSSRQIGMYVMISDRVAAAGNNVMYNVFTLLPGDTAVNEKNDPVHSITKEVREDSLHTPNTNTGWGERNAAEIAQPIDFRILVDFAPTEGVYKVQDYMPHFDHLDLDKVTVNFNGADEFVKGKDYTIKAYTNGTDVGVGFEIELTPEACAIIEDTSTLEIRYTACLKSQADKANVNTATLYHKDKEVEGKHAPQWENVGADTTTTYTYKLVVSKVDEDGNALEGAEFVLKAGSATATDNFDFVSVGNLTVTVPDVDNKTKEITAPAYAVTHPVTSSASTNDPETITTGPGGTFIICGLDSNDNYYLVETKVPAPDANKDGKADITYAKADPAHIFITPNPSIEAETFIRTATVINLPTVDMPETGGMGTTIFYIAGGLLTAAALILLVTKKRMGA